MPTFNFSPTDSPAAIMATMNGAAAGDSFEFAPGIYRGLTWTPKANQVVRSAPGGQATLSGARLLIPGDFTPFTDSGLNYYRVQIAHSFFPSDQTIGSYIIGNEPGYERAWMNIAVWVDDVAWRNMNTLASLDVVPNAFYVDYAASPQYLYIKPDPISIGAPIEMNSTLFLCEFVVPGLRFENIIIEKYASRIQRAPVYCSNPTTGSGMTWINVTSQRNTSCGVRVGSGASISASRLLHNSMAGYSGKGDNISIVGSEIAWNNWARVNRGFEGGAGKLSGGASTSCDNAAIRGCYIHDNYGKGIWFDIECGYDAACLIEYNLITNHHDAGIFWETCFDAIIRGNILINNCNAGTHTNQPYNCQLMVVNSQARLNRFLQVYENTVVVPDLISAGGGIGVTQSNRGFSVIAPSIELLTKRVRVFNNRVYHLGGRGRNGLAANYDSANFFNSYDNQFQGNTYFTLSASDSLFQYSGSNQTFTAWQANPIPQDTAASGAALILSVAGAPDASAWSVRADTRYRDRLRAYDLLVYYPMDEPVGATTCRNETLYNLQNTHNAPYVNVTTGTPGLTADTTAALFTASPASRVIMLPSDLDTHLLPLIDFDTISLACWLKPSPEFWADGVTRGIVRLGETTAAGQGFYRIDKSAADTIRFYASNGVTSKTITVAGQSFLNWTLLMMTYNRIGNAMKAYINGVQVGTTQTGLGTGGATSVSGVLRVGASTGATSGNLPGQLDHVFITRGYAFSDAEAAALADFNSAPVLALRQSLPSAQVGQPFAHTLVLSASDDSGAPPILSWIEKPSWLAFDGVALSGIPPAGSAGIYYFALKASDSGGKATTVPLALSVAPAASSGGASEGIGTLGACRRRLRLRLRGKIWR